MEHPKKILLLLPPLTQLNTPYPSITHLTGYLRNKGYEADQMDLGIELVDVLFTGNGVSRIFDIAEKSEKKGNKNIRNILSNRSFYEQNVKSVIDFLRGKDRSSACRFSNLGFWDSMPRIPDEEELEWTYGTSGSTDRAKYLCSMFIKNICDVIETYVDHNFSLIRYAEKICTYLPEFDIVERIIARSDTFVTETMITLLDRHLSQARPDVVAISVPFPGNLVCGLLCARHIKELYPDTDIVLGGGYVNTELRQMSDPGIFRYVDYVMFDDGELPLLHFLEGKPLLRTAHCIEGKVVYENMDSCENERFAALPAPTTEGLPLNLYLDFPDSFNPMHRLWSDGKWNKMMLAHGCYHARCTFCDTKLDYIGRYESCNVSIIVDRMEALMEETGESGFHFVDEAAPPAVLRKLAEEIIRRKLTVSYWTNIRFDKSFTPDLCFLLMKSGCIAVSGGLEVASPRILKLIDKGVTIESARECMRNLTAQGIMVHAYLMYGFPTQTERELMESLATVRDMFAEGLIHSAFWHRYAMTCHSISGNHTERFNARLITSEPNPFANNEIGFTTDNAPDWDKFTEGLHIATYNYMRSTGFDIPLKRWFNKKQ